MSYEEEDTCMSYEEEDTCHMRRRIHACHMRRRIHRNQKEQQKLQSGGVEPAL